MKNKTKVIIIISLIMLVVLSIYIYNEVQAKYILSKSVQISYTTSDYYFDVTVDTTEISSFPATLTVTAKNNDGTNYTNEDLTYTIGVDNSNYTVTATGENTRTITGGSKQEESYTITIEKTGTDDSESINLTFTVSKPYSDSKSINLSVSTIPAYYGKVVTNYTYTASGVDTWRIFHIDDDGYIYLIADDYVPYENLPKSTAGNALNQGDSTYPGRAYFTNVLSDYSGSAWIRTNTNTNAQKWLSYVESYPTSEYNNIKAVAYMMDTTQWSKFANCTYAEYAIGGPTLELYCASYKVTHPDKYIVCTVASETGYQVKWSSDSSYANYITGATQDDFNSIYIKSSTINANGMWVASPSANDADNVMAAHWSGDVDHDPYYNTNRGFRPLVCLKSGVELVSNGDGTYKIQWKDPDVETYGKVVTNYTCTSSGVDTWRVFYKDDSNIYLIADDYVPNANLPKSTGNAHSLNTNGTYKAYFTNVLSDYTGSEWIRTNTNTNAQKWLSYVASYPTSENNNIKAVAYMMDTAQWSGFANEDLAEYAIGGPTLELYCASYKVTHPDKYIECTVESSTGYKVKWSTATSYTLSVGKMTKDDFNKIYINSDSSTAYGYWLASPSAGDTTGVRYDNYYGEVSYGSYNKTNYAFRPLVCLKSSVSLVKNEDGETYKIQ